MRQARATRFYAEVKDGSASIDMVEVDTATGQFSIGYEHFVAFFGLEIRKGHEIAFAVKATVLPERKCTVPR